MQSMTGFGRAEHASEGIIARVEITTVNRKQADIHFNLPRELGRLESSLRKMVLQVVSRGRVNISIHLEKAGADKQALGVDLERALALEAAFEQLADSLSRPLPLSAQDFLKTPGILTLNDSTWDEEEALEAIHPALRAALEKLIEMRRAEGADLKADLLARLHLLEQEVHHIMQASPLVTSRQRELLHKRLRDSGLEIDLDDERLLKEVALFAERCDISEEVTRLSSHFGRFREYLDSPDPAGRSLDFLCQEINREFNTIGSKANDAGIGQKVVTAKTELEKIREQVQNIE